MIELPLFPLNAVLFPAGPLEMTITNLHYMPLIADCIHQNQPFGAVLIQSGDPHNSLLTMPHTIGCTARIFIFEMVEKNALRILALGIERFRILGLRYDRPYLVGRIEPYPFQNPDPLALKQADQTLRPLVERYLTLLAEAHNVPFSPDQLPEAPLALACLGAYLLQIPLEQKQELLALDQALDLAQNTETHYHRQLALLEAQLTHPDTQTQGPFSSN